MSEVQVIKSPEVLAAEIRSIHSQTVEIVSRAAIEIGKRLNEAKELVKHGEWKTWLEDNVNYSQSTANNFMRMAKEYGENSQAVGNLSYTKALALLGVPAEEREQFAEEHDAENISARELERAIKEKKEADRRAEEAEMARQEAEARVKAAEEARAKAEADQRAQAGVVDQLQHQLAAAHEAGDSEEVARLQGSLDAAKDVESKLRDKIQELQEELKSKPIEAAVVEKVPEAVEAELAQLRQQVSRMSAGEAASEFKFNFEALINRFQTVLSCIEKFPEEERGRYKGAVLGLIGKMQESLQ